MSGLTSPKATASASAAKPNSLRRKDGDATATTSRDTPSASKAAHSDSDSLVASTSLLSLEEPSSSVDVSRGSGSTSTAAASRAAQGRGGAPIPTRTGGTSDAARGARGRSSAPTSIVTSSASRLTTSATPPRPSAATHSLMIHCWSFAGGSTSTAFYGCLVPHSDFCVTMKTFRFNEGQPCQHPNHYRVVCKRARNGGEEDQYAVEDGLTPLQSQKALVKEALMFDSLSRLQGTTIPVYYGAWTDEPDFEPSYVFEDVGYTLNHRHIKLLRLSPAEKTRIEARCARLLDELHAAQCVHRDLQASNICIRTVPLDSTTSTVPELTAAPTIAPRSPPATSPNTLSPSHSAGSIVATQAQKRLKITLIDLSHARIVSNLKREEKEKRFRRDREQLKMIFEQLDGW